MTGYSLAMYGRMAADTVRFRAYSEALRRTVRPETTVIDLGAGTGVFSLLAARLGARRVYAVEPDDAIEVARALAEASGLAERITFLQMPAHELQLGEKVDVLVSDLRGATPVFAGHLEAIADARDRLLRPGGVQIPARDTLWAAPVESPRDATPIERPWGENDLGLDLAPLRERLENDARAGGKEPPRALAPPARWVLLDYARARPGPLAGKLCWHVEGEGTAHGARLWFETELLEGIRFDTSPWSEETIYGNVFLPFRPGLALRAGDVLRLSLRAAPVRGDWIWSWETTTFREGRATIRGEPQSTFLAAPLSPRRLRLREASALPRLSREGELASFVLARLDGTRTNEEIARLLLESFPAAARTPAEALDLVTGLAERFARL